MTKLEQHEEDEEKLVMNIIGWVASQGLESPAPTDQQGEPCPKLKPHEAHEWEHDEGKSFCRGVDQQAVRHHWRDGVYFTRSVITPGEVELEITIDDRTSMHWSIPPNEWASIIAAMSGDGDTAEKYSEAVRFHD